MLKFLDPTGSTHQGEKRFAYNLPGRGEKWARTDHPSPSAPDGRDCGPGRLHLMKVVSSAYAPADWWPWHAKGIFLIGESSEKASFASVILSAITPKVWHRFLRRFGREVNLRGADLHGAKLCGADLRGANLRGANLREVNLCVANLCGADLREVNLHEANLCGADLRGADLCGADLHRAKINKTLSA